MEIYNLLKQDLDKAAGQLKAGDKAWAAMTIGFALEKGLRQLFAKQFFAGGVPDRNQQVPGAVEANNALAKAGVYSQATHRQIEAWFKLWVTACQQQQVPESKKEVTAVLAAVRLFFASVKEPVPLPEASFSLRMIQAILAEPNLTDADKLDKIRAELITPGRAAPDTPLGFPILRDLSPLLTEKTRSL